MKRILLGSLLLLEMAAVMAGGYHFRPADGEDMRGYSEYGDLASQYAVPLNYPYPQMPRYSQSQWSGAGALPAYPQSLDFMSNWELAEPQLFEPPTDLPYADFYQGAEIRTPQPFYTSSNGQRWRGIAWPENNLAPNGAYVPATIDGFKPLQSVFSPQLSRQGEVSPGRNSAWR